MSRAGDVCAHYQQIWGELAEACPFDAGPVGHLPEDFRVVRFAPSPRRELWTYATAGMSRRGDVDPIELHLFSPDASPELVELLFATAHFHRTGAKLNLSHTVNFGQPWLSGSTCSYGLISLPYLDGQDLELFRLGSDLVRCLWLIPVTSREVAFKKEHGLEALEQRFEEVGFNYADPSRPSVV